MASGDLTLALGCRLAAPPSSVWDAFTDPDRLARWWGPRGFSIPSLRFEPRVGEGYRIEMQPPEGAAFFLAGQFRAVEQPRRLAFTFRWEEPDPDDVENVAELVFRDAGESTELALAQGPFRTEARRSLHHDGWSDSLDKLDALLSRG